MNIYQRINEVRKSVAYVQKDAQIIGYKAVTHDQVTAVLREMLVKHGIVISQSVIKSEFKETGDLTAKGTKWMMYIATYTIKFINIEEPSDFLEVNVESQALDTGDKASGKAMSYAVKYAMLKTFSLETGENEEGRQDDFKQKREGKEEITQEVKQEIVGLIQETESDTNKLLSFFKVKSVDAMNAQQGEQAIKMLKAKQ